MQVLIFVGNGLLFAGSFDDMISFKLTLASSVSSILCIVRKICVKNVIFTI